MNLIVLFTIFMIDTYLDKTIFNLESVIWIKEIDELLAWLKLSIDLLDTT